MKPKISIIVPIYNVEEYLRRCLDSLLTQSLTDIEVIAINDGSPDSSLQILKDYALKDNRLKIIDQSNSGVSSARNAGIEAATGEYIGFVDPDDWIDKEMYKIMYQTAVTEQADIVMCSYIREFGSHSKEKEFHLPEKVCYYDDEVKTNIMRRLVGPLNDEVGNPEMLDAWGTVWSKLYKVDLIKENGIKFTDLSKLVRMKIHCLIFKHSIMPNHSFFLTSLIIIIGVQTIHLLQQAIIRISFINGLIYTK